MPHLVAAEDDPAQTARDKVIVETVQRISGFDLNSSEKAKAAVLRHMRRNQGTDEYFRLAKRFPMPEIFEDLEQMATKNSADTVGVNAARLLLKFDRFDQIQNVIETSDDETATGMIHALGLVGGQKVAELITPVVSQEKRALAVRSTAASAIGRNVSGQKHLLSLVCSETLPNDLKFTVANILFASRDASIRDEAAKHLQLPQTANSDPLPPLAELVARRGDVENGRKVFSSNGTCFKCHIVNGQGKEVGPDQSEVGSKLSREAMYVAILDPSAGISHNYETHSLILEDGTQATGILISETDESVTIKTAEAIVRTIDRDEIEFMRKQAISMMPADLQKTMTVDQLVDVVEYLTTLKKKEP